MTLLMCESDHVFLNSNEHPRANVVVETRDARFVRETKQAWPLHQYHRLAKLMHELRPVKSAEEIAPGEESRAFYRLPVRKRVVIMLGGPTRVVLCPCEARNSSA